LKQLPFQKKLKMEPQFEEYLVIRDFLKEQKKGDIYPDDHLILIWVLILSTKVNLQVFLESTFGIKISGRCVLNNPTVEKLSRFIERGKKTGLLLKQIKWAEILKEKVDA